MSLPLLSIQIIRTIRFCPLNLAGWRFLCLFYESIGKNNFLPDNEKIQYTRDICPHFGAKLENAIIQILGIRLSKLRTSFRNQVDYMHNFCLHLLIQTLDKIPSRFRSILLGIEDNFKFPHTSFPLPSPDFYIYSIANPPRRVKFSLPVINVFPGLLSFVR